MTGGVMYVYKDLIVVDDVNYSDGEYKSIKSQVSKIQSPQVVITKKQALELSTEDFEKLCVDFSSCDILIHLTDDLYSDGVAESDIFSKEETADMKKKFEICQSHNCNLYLSDMLYNFGEVERNKIPFTKALEASAKINDWVNQIETANVNGTPLSQFEKYLYAYSIVTNFRYKEGENINESRDLSRILTGDKIVCVGYAHLLAELCNRLGIPCKPQAVFKGSQKDYKEGVCNHENCMLYLFDEKYGIDGFFMADACFDSFDGTNKPKTLSHSLINYSDISKIFTGKNKIFINEDKDEVLSCCKFLQRLGIIDDEQLFIESEDASALAKNMLVSGKADEEIESFMQNSWDLVKSGREEIDDSVLIDGYVDIDEVSTFAAKTLLNCMYADYGMQSVDPDEEFDKLLGIIKSVQTNLPNITEVELTDLIKNKIKSFDYSDSNELLMAIASFVDENFILGDAYSTLKTLRETQSVGATFDAYQKALFNVSISRGMSEDVAKRHTEKKLNQSVDFAGKYWNLSEDCKNPFACRAIELMSKKRRD